uniref:NADH-ubiquinone oxidoreductase chain 4 n=1 Tax=Ichneutes sp. QL-2013 TaxID=1421596 RepID=A0A0A6ZKZ3_9HYME|nr:NADH dehydrogenase subunit 4 [Ichneutes sp. QL-2013]
MLWKNYWSLYFNLFSSYNRKWSMKNPKYKLMMKITFLCMYMIYLMKFKKSINLYPYIIMLMLTMMPWNFMFSKIFFNFMMDSISFNLILLSIWIMMLSFLTSYKFSKIKNKLKYYLILTFMLLILIKCFLSMNLFFFYFFFETSLIPMLMLIMGWGNQIDRIQASLYMILYTLFGSLPLLLMMIYFFKTYNSLQMNILNMINLNNLMNIFFFIMLTLGFLVKMPMYMIHLWLPKAHVEAPISGSMILAGIMLKLGSYGIYRMMTFNNLLFKNFCPMILILNLIGSMYASLICLNNSDLKIIVAYSSIVHMNMMLASLICMSNWSFLGSMMMMISHGICSSGMFCLVNFNYERIKSRNMFLNKGLLNIMPSLTLWWFLLCSSNFSAPPSLNLFSEIILFNSMIMWFKYLMIMIMPIIFFSTYYSIYLYSYTQHGNYNLNLFNFKNINIKELLINLMHWLPLNLIFLNLNIYM